MTAPPPRVLLFDIDGTLVHAGGAGRRALEAAMEAHLEGRAGRREAWLGAMKLDGMTDRGIVREAVVALGVAYDEPLCQAILATYVERLPGEIGGPGYEVLPGVLTLLQALATRGTLTGLCTGNVLAGARIKLDHGGLTRFFGFGADDVFGFAEDAEAREGIVRAAVRRAGARLGRPLPPEEALVIGDTPRDIHAAHAAGCPALGVATGRFSVEELRAAGADVVVPTLESQCVRALLLGE